MRTLAVVAWASEMNPARRHIQVDTATSGTLWVRGDGEVLVQQADGGQVDIAGEELLYRLTSVPSVPVSLARGARLAVDLGLFGPRWTPWKSAWRAAAALVDPAPIPPGTNLKGLVEALMRCPSAPCVLACHPDVTVRTPLVNVLTRWKNPSRSASRNLLRQWGAEHDPDPALRSALARVG